MNFEKRREFYISTVCIKVGNVTIRCTMCILCIILLSLLTLIMVKKTVDMEARLKSIEKEMDLLKRSNRILKRNNKKFERIVIGVLVRSGRNPFSRTISDLRDERKGYNTSYVKKIETMAEEQISTDTKRAKEDPNMDVTRQT